MRILTATILFYASLCTQLSGITSEDQQDSVPSLMSAFLDANQIGMHVSNNGSLARDEKHQYGYYNGFYYPLDSAITLIYSAGLWMTAQVNGTRRVAMAEYGSEFAPGPYDYPSVDDSSLFRVYKISNQDGSDTTTDWQGWPVSLGAPVDTNGDPLVTGKQSMWTVFNDGDISRHTRRGGSTQPLGAEVQLYVYALTDAGWLDQVVFLEYTIINKSSSWWNDFIVGIWSDPDIGTYTDDIGGSDSLLSLAYCYTLHNDAELPNDFEPAVGVMLLGSPSSENSGHPSGSANVLVNNFRSRNPEMTLDILEGRDLSGNDYVNPVTGKVTRYRFTGDPRSGKGWLDPGGKGDRKTVVASAPVDVAPGDTVRMTAAFVAVSGKTLFTAIDSLFQVVHTLYDYHNFGLSGAAFSDRGVDGVIKSVTFDPPEQLWFDGYDWGGSAFLGGIGCADELWGTSLMRSENIDVEIEFSPDSGQVAASFLVSDGVYEFDKFVTVPLICKRLSDSAQLNLILIDKNRNGRWDVSADPNGNADILLILKSRYRQRPLSSYIRRVFPRDALETDLMYVVSLTQREGYEYRNIKNDQRLTIIVTDDLSGAHSDTLNFGDVVVGHIVDIPLFITSRYRFPKNVRLNIDPPGRFRLSKSKLKLADTMILSVEFEPLDTIEYTAVISALVTELNMPVAEIVLTGRGAAWPLDGDLFTDGALDIKDLVSFAAYLFGDYRLPDEIVCLDLNQSGEVNLDDLILLANRIFRSAD